MEPLEPVHARPAWWTCLVLGVGLFGCARGDVSGYLAGGRCDDQGRCADGYVCATDAWQCVTAGGLPDAAQADGADSGGAEADATTADGSSETAAPGCQQNGCPCAEETVLCDGKCVNPSTDSSHCGSCGNTCLASGATLACGNYLPGACDCAGDDARCGAQAGQSLCDPATGLCVCDGSTCVRGETCRSDASGKTSCSCDGVLTCKQGWTCCIGHGCVDLKLTADHCGACGKTCPQTFYCLDGSCRCRNAKGCDAGFGGTCTSAGRCECGGVVCAPGQRCVAAGSCG